jgi:hypothetical protein
MNYLTPQLKQEIEKKIAELELEDKYFKDMIFDISPGSSSSSIDEGAGGQVGTSIPRYFGAMDTFIANPSNVSLGILARMMETDDTVMSSVQFKSMMMLSKIGEYQHKDIKIAEFVRTFLARMEGPTFMESLEAQSSHGGYGFSVSEIMWKLNKQMQKVPQKVKTYHPTTIAFEVDPYGEVTEQGVIQFTTQTGQLANPNNFFPYFQNGFSVRNPFSTPEDRLLPYRIPFANTFGMARIPKNKVIHHVNNSMLAFGSPYGKSPVRTAHLAWQLKVFFMKQMGIAGKRQASPFIWGTAPRSTNKDRVMQNDGSFKDFNPIEALSSILARRDTDDSIVTGPDKEGYNIQAIAAQTNLDQFLNVIDHLNTYIFRAFLLPSLVMTDGSAGSRSLGDKHFQMVDRMAEADAQKFGQTIINQLIRPAIEMNFGEQDEYGHFAQRPQNIEERERLANIFASLANSGYMKAYDKVDNEYVRSTLHLPDQEESFFAETSPNMSPLDGEMPEELPDETGNGENEPQEKEAASEMSLKKRVELRPIETENFVRSYKISTSKIEIYKDTKNKFGAIVVVPGVSIFETGMVFDSRYSCEQAAEAIAKSHQKVSDNHSLASSELHSLSNYKGYTYKIIIKGQLPAPEFAAVIEEVDKKTPWFKSATEAGDAAWKIIDQINNKA